ncbi:MAG: PorT family protein, partial [Chitinophagaceae bacterium]
SVTSKGKPGITLGIISDVPLGRSASFMPALNFVQKGGTLTAGGVKDKLTTNYLEVPLNFVYHAKTGSGKLFFGAGPAFNIGISGKDKWDAEGSSGNDKVEFGKDKDFRRLDAGLNIVTGYTGKSGLLVTLNYNTGLSNSVDSEGEGKFRNRYFGFRIGYML